MSRVWLGDAVFTSGSLKSAARSIKVIVIVLGSPILAPWVLD